MKKILLSVVTAAILSTGMAHAATGVQKNINIIATINDAIFVSKPDGSTWYDTEELFARDYTQTSFASNDLPVRIYSKSADVQVSLVNPLTVHRNDGVQFANVVVNFAGQTLAAPGGTKTDVVQTTVANGGFDNTYTLKITADAPATLSGTAAANGQYQGDLVMMFEPKP